MSPIACIDLCDIGIVYMSEVITSLSSLVYITGLLPQLTRPWRLSFIQYILLITRVIYSYHSVLGVKLQNSSKFVLLGY